MAQSSKSKASRQEKCPICFKDYDLDDIEAHVNKCLEIKSSPPTSKKMKLDLQAWGSLARSPSTQKASSSDKDSLLSSKLAENVPKTLIQDSQKVSKNSNSLKHEKSNLNAPLAERMRPKDFKEYFGHESVIGKNSILKTLLNNNDIPSLIMWGPPGCGKTSLINVIAKSCKENKSHKFHMLSATTSGIADVKKVVEAALVTLKMFKMKTILFIDEIHRFNKLQQDSFLPHIESGTFVLMGATTENPSFSLNKALMSRCKVIRLEKLTTENLVCMLKSTVDRLQISIESSSSNEENKNKISIEQSALELIANMSDGDARTALNTLEIAIQGKSDSVQSKDKNTNCKVINDDDIKRSFISRQYFYDRSGDEHYQTISAFIKSMRGSDASASMYWMCRMLNGGEDPKFIARRMVIFASEDVGLADANALNIAVSTYQSCQFIGLPECGIILAECCTYLARAPKSIESYAAFSRTMEFIKEFKGPQPGVPLHLRNASTTLMKAMGYGKDYAYPPNNKGNLKQSYLPKELADFDCFKEMNDEVR